VRIFSAVRQIRTSSSVTWAFYILAVNKRTAHGSAASAGAAPAAASLVKFRSYPLTNNIHALVVRFTKPSRGNGAAVGHGHATAQRIYCDLCHAEANVEAVVNVDAATPAVAAPLTAQLKDLLSQNGATGSIFRRVHVARYDNGHAFKVRAKGARAALRGVVDALLAQRTSDVLAKIEKSLDAKIG
jgi:hypothetical protein